MGCVRVERDRHHYVLRHRAASRASTPDAAADSHPARGIRIFVRALSAVDPLVRAQP
ncbi:hypothetical protein CZ774_03775 [Frigoribacterium sp. JB110]|nr:hypothetical protein CZ774_03775 [Frigoribacterium sp. JB110]